MPAETALGGLAEDGFVLAKFFEDNGAFSPELGRIVFQGGDQGDDRGQAVFAAIPLGWRELFEEVWIACAFFDEQRHRAFVSGEELDKRADAQLERDLFYRILMPGQRASVDEDIEAGVLTLDYDVHRCRHVLQFTLTACDLRVLLSEC